MCGTLCGTGLCQLEPSLPPPSLLQERGELRGSVSRSEAAGRVTRLLLRPQEDLSEAEVTYREAVCRLSPKLALASTLSSQFMQIVRERKCKELPTWLHKAKTCSLEEFRRFARGLEKEYDALAAALSEEWSTGQVEGQITRLKYLKRQMYGRAKIDLLRLRVLHPT